MARKHTDAILEGLKTAGKPCEPGDVDKIQQIMYDVKELKSNASARALAAGLVFSGSVQRAKDYMDDSPLRTSNPFPWHMYVGESDTYYVVLKETE